MKSSNYFSDQPVYFTYGPRIEMFGGRPDRDTVISKDDILNLKIELGLDRDVNEFLKVI